MALLYGAELSASTGTAIPTVGSLRSSSAEAHRRPAIRRVIMMELRAKWITGQPGLVSIQHQRMIATRFNGAQRIAFICRTQMLNLTPAAMAADKPRWTKPPRRWWLWGL